MFYKHNHQLSYEEDIYGRMYLGAANYMWT